MRLLLTFLLLSSPALAAQHTVTFSWSLPSADSFPACSATVTSDCIVGTNLYQVVGSALTQLNLLPIPVVPGSTSATKQTTSIVWNHLGTATAVATCLAKDSTGVQQESGQSNAYTFRSTVYAPTNLAP